MPIPTNTHAQDILYISADAEEVADASSMLPTSVSPLTLTPWLEQKLEDMEVKLPVVLNIELEPSCVTNVAAFIKSISYHNSNFTLVLELPMDAFQELIKSLSRHFCFITSVSLYKESEALEQLLEFDLARKVLSVKTLALTKRKVVVEVVLEKL